MERYQQKLREAYQTTSVIGYCTSVSVIVYGLITFFLLSRSVVTEEADGAEHRWVLIIGAIGAAIFLGMAGIRALVMRFNRPPEVTVEGAIKQLQSTAMVVFGFCESISILGLVAALVTRQMQNYYWMAFLSLIAFGTYFPRYDRWDRHVHRLLHPYLEGGKADGSPS